MNRLLEYSLLLRSFNYLRVSHDYARRYNWYYPLALCVFSSFFSVNLSTISDELASGDFFRPLLPILTVIAPFYIAALAAVSTFSGNGKIDSPFQMANPVTIELRGEGGSWEAVDVSPRHLLSLLFGYCTSLSLFLLVFILFSPALPGIAYWLIGDKSQYALVGLVFPVIFFLAQLFFNTLVGVYLLSDYLHRG